MKTDLIQIYEMRLSLNTELHIRNYHTYRNDIPWVSEKPAQDSTAVLIHQWITLQPESLKTDIQILFIRILLNDF